MESIKTFFYHGESFAVHLFVEVEATAEWIALLPQYYDMDNNLLIDTEDKLKAIVLQTALEFSNLFGKLLLRKDAAEKVLLSTKLPDNTKIAFIPDRAWPCQTICYYSEWNERYGWISMPTAPPSHGGLAEEDC